MKITSFLKSLGKPFFVKGIFKEKATASPEEVLKREDLFYSQYILPGMTVFDVGANIGELTVTFSDHVGENGVVHAFEPTTATFKRLTKMIQIKGIENVTLNHCALADKMGVEKFHVYDSSYSTFNTLATRPLKEYGIDIEPSIEEVTTMTVDDYCQKNSINQIDLLKIDVEGAELEVLLGAKNMMKDKRIRCCIFEFGQTVIDMGTNPQDIIEFLQNCGYRVRNLIEGDRVFPIGGKSSSLAKFSMHIAEPT